MTYSLEQILKDKKLRGKLAEADFAFEDGNGVFALDFQEQSILKNHRETFDRLCELGGEALLEKILAEGKTCLTDDPNAAKQGVRAIKGTDRFFLKTNAGAPTALASIFFGIAGWAEESGEFDAELVSCTVGSEEECAEECAEEDVGDDFDFFSESKEPPADGWYYKEKLVRLAKTRSCSIITKNGKTCLFDEENREFVSFAALNGLDSITVEEMYACEKLSDGEEEFETCYGYKYQLEKDGKWGFISRHLIQCIAPKFDDILVTDRNRFGASLLAWAKKDDGRINLWSAGSVTHTDEYDCLETDYWFSNGLDEVGEKFFDLDSAYIPQTDASMNALVAEGEGGVLYFPSGSSLSALFFSRDAEGFFAFTEDGWIAQWEASYRRGFWKFKRVQNEFEKMMGGEECEDVKEIPAPILLNAAICRMAISGENTVDAVSCVEADEKTGIYVVRRDGYYAAAKLKLGTEIRIQRLLTPYAFTGIEAFDNRFLKVDLFGKKGVFDIVRQQYVVPCDYEAISFDGVAERFTVYRMGFAGQLSAQGKWVKHLQREEQ